DSGIVCRWIHPAGNRSPCGYTIRRSGFGLSRTTLKRFLRGRSPLPQRGEAALRCLGFNSHRYRPHAKSEARARSQRHTESRTLSRRMNTGTNIETEQTAVSGHSLQMGKSNFAGGDRPTWDLYATCVHCGLCLNHCPTYRVLGMEMDSPRGRIYQVLQVDAGRLPIAESFVTHIDRCLDCRACESACPSGVQYGHIVERARAQIEQHYQRPWLARQIRSFFYRHVLGDRKRLSQIATLLRFYQRSGLQSLAQHCGVLKLMGMAELDRLQPRVDDRFFFEQFGQVFPASGERRARVAFHAGCIASVAFSALNEATVRVLTKNGVEVCVPAGQNCCGALQAHAGFRDEARALARQNIAAMLDDRFDAVVTNAAGCGSTLKEYGDLLREDGQCSDAERFAEKVKDVTEFLN